MMKDKVIAVKVGDVIGEVVHILSGPLGEDYYKLAEGKVTSITVNSKGRKVKAKHFYTLDANEIESNTEWLLEIRGVLVGEPFILLDELRNRVETWIKKTNAFCPDCGSLNVEEEPNG